MTSPLQIDTDTFEALLSAGQTDKAWALLEPGLAGLERNLPYALCLADLLHADAGHARLMDLALRLSRAWPTTAALMIRLSAALVAAAERRPPDEPPFERGPAHLAAAICQNCFDSLGATERQDPTVGGRLKANEANALRLMGPEHDEDSLKAFQLASTIDDSNGHWWFQRGLLHKWRGRFGDGSLANGKALERLGDSRPLLFNQAIFATALGEGERAVEAWRRVGIDARLNDAGMAVVEGMPRARVRVATVGYETGRNDPLPGPTVAFETVWVQPFSPCHGAIISPTVRRATVDQGDVVLWEPAPVRVQQAGGDDVPIFPLIWTLRQGEERRLRFVCMAEEQTQLEALQAGFGGGATLVVYDQRGASAGRLLCYGKLIVPVERPLSAVRIELEGALRSLRGCTLSMPELYEALGDTPAAGKAHQAWGGIERAGEQAGLLPRPRA